MTCRKRVKITRFHKIIGGTRVGGERYGYLYKALSVTEGERKYTYGSKRVRDKRYTVEYEYSKSGQIVARTANGVRQTYEYDGRGQLLAVKEDGADVECYVYDKAGNMLKKTIRGKTTTFAFDGANQRVSSTTDGVTTKYAYDAAGRLVKEGDKAYRYGYLDKVLFVTEGERKYTYDYHVDGQLARADYGNGGRAGCPQPAGSEDFLWDGLALIKRGDERFVNEPHVGNAPKKLRFEGKPRAQRSARRARKGPRGNPVASSKGTTYFNDMLGTTLGAKNGRKYTPAALTAFGETIENGSVRSTPTPSTYTSFYTGKPEVAGLGHAFLFRNYRASFAKWQTADPLGYPDGWNQLAYCGNSVILMFDYQGAASTTVYSETQWQASFGDGSVGYPLLSAFDYMKDKWELGSAILNLLGIKTIEDFLEKIEHDVDGRIKEQLEKLVEDGLWFDALMQANGSGYERIKPSNDAIDEKVTQAIGDKPYTVISIELIKVIPDIELVSGIKFINGCNQKWKVVVQYE